MALNHVVMDTTTRGGTITDLSTFHSLWIEHSLQERILRYCFKYLGHRHDAEEATSETYLRLARKIREPGGYIRLREAFETIVFRTARNICIDLLRQHKTDRLSEQEYDPWMLEERSTTSLAVREALTQLREDYRLPLILCDLDELPAREAAEVLFISVPALKSRLYRGRRALRNLLIETFPCRNGESNGKVSKQTSGKMPKEETMGRRDSRRNGFLTYPDCPFSSVADFAEAFFQHCCSRGKLVSRSKATTICTTLFQRRYQGTDQTELARGTILTRLKQSRREDEIGHWLGLFQHHTAFLPGQLARQSEACGLKTPQSHAVSFRVLEGVKPLKPPGKPWLFPIDDNEQEPEVEYEDEAPAKTVVAVKSDDHGRHPLNGKSNGAVPKSVRPRLGKKKRLTLFRPNNLFPTIETLATAVATANDRWGEPKSVLRLLRQSRRKRGALDERLRATVVEIIFDYETTRSERYCRSRVKEFTADFPAGPGTPEYLLVN